MLQNASVISFFRFNALFLQNGI